MNEHASSHPHATPPWPTPAARASALLRRLALPLLLAATAQAQAQPAGSGSFVQLQLSGCGTTSLSGQGTLEDGCIFNNGPGSQGTASGNGSNLFGILRGNALAAATGASMFSESRSAWDDRFTFLGGPVPASASFQFHLFGAVTLLASGPSATTGFEVDYRAFLRPFGSWGGPGSFASGTLGDRRTLQTAGAPLNEFHPVQQAMLLQVSLAGIGVGNSLDLSTTFLLRSNASAGAGGSADAQSVFFNSAGLTGIQFFDAAGADITSQVQYAWQWGTQFVTPVPEVPALWLALAGLAGVLARRRLQR